MTHVIDRINVENPEWPWKVLVQMDSYDILGVPGLSIKEMLDRLVSQFDHTRLFFLPHQGNDSVLVMGEKRGSNAMEVHILSTDCSFAFFRECRRLLSYVKNEMPYKLILAKTSIVGLDSVLQRLGFTYDFTIEKHDLTGEDMKYFHLNLE
jgi:hypothetical protein